MKQKYSAVIGIAGGIVDLIAGLSLVQPIVMMEGESMMVQSTALWTGYFLMALGVIVLLTGLYLLTARLMGKRSLAGALMLIYGVIMLVLGVGMLGRMFSMMQGSTFSGAVMLVVGITMLYSGWGMAKKQPPN